MPQNDVATRFGERLLASLGLRRSLPDMADHTAIAWKRAGLLELGGEPDGPAQMVPLLLASAADGAMMALKVLADQADRLPDNGALLLGERARLMGLSRNGRSSPSGHCRLLDTQDGRIALNLAREADWDLLTAWLERPVSDWEELAGAVSPRDAAPLVERGAELGLPIALDQLRSPRPWFEEKQFSKHEDRRERPLVADLSGLWAGPLAGNLLGQMGCDVIKVESLSRPDGARQGNAEFFRMLNAGKRCAAFDFATPEGRGQLKKLISAADVIIEASRPRALRQLGIDAERLLAERPGKIWLRLMAHGEDETRIGFGDDIGVSAGLPTIMERAWGRSSMVGDAIADPLSGIFAALAAWAKWRQGGGYLLNLSMSDIVRTAMQWDEKVDLSALAQGWQAMAQADNAGLYPMRTAVGEAAALGAHTDDIMASLC